MSLKISKEGITLNGNVINNISKLIPRPPPRNKPKKQPNKKDNNKIYRDFIKTARLWPKYEGMTYREFLTNSRGDYDKWKGGCMCDPEYFSSSDEEFEDFEEYE